jgi:hypothetical protein
MVADWVLAIVLVVLAAIGIGLLRAELGARSVRRARKLETVVRFIRRKNERRKAS